MQHAVRLRHQLGDHAGLAECFDGVAADLAALGRAADAARLLGAAAPDASVAFVLALDPPPDGG